MEAGIGGLRHEVMDAVAELVEERDDFVVLEEGWLALCRFAEVADECCGGVVTGAVFADKTLPGVRKACDGVRFRLPVGY